MNGIIIALGIWFIIGGLLILKKKLFVWKSTQIVKGQLIGWHKKNNFYIPIVEYFDKEKKKLIKVILENDSVLGLKPLKRFSSNITMWLVVNKDYKPQSFIRLLLETLFPFALITLGLIFMILLI